MGSGAMVLDRPVTAPAEAPERDFDTHLVAAVRRGDDRAFEQLYSRYQRRISAYIFGMVKDHGRAEDITQEVFISALRRMRDTDRAIAFKPWIYEIAKNACIDQFRRSRRTEEVSFDAGEGLGGHDQGRLVASEPTPDDAVDAKQQLEQLCGAFGGPLGLPPRDPRPARVRRPLLPRDRRPHGPQPPRRREHPLPRPQAPDRGVRRARLRPALRAHPVDHRLRRERRAGRARHAPPRPPHLPLPAVPPPGGRLRDRRRRSWRASRSASASPRRSPACCRSRPSSAPACGTAASRWSPCPSRRPPPGPRPWPSPRRCSSRASAPASRRRRAARRPDPRPAREAKPAAAASPSGATAAGPRAPAGARRRRADRASQAPRHEPQGRQGDGLTAQGRAGARAPPRAAARATSPTTPASGGAGGSGALAVEWRRQAQQHRQDAQGTLGRRAGDDPARRPTRSTTPSARPARRSITPSAGSPTRSTGRRTPWAGP